MACPPLIRWTPDGKAIVYREGSFGLWRQAIDGGSPQRVPGLPDEKIGCFGWSRDGKLFAFERNTEFRDVVMVTNSNQHETYRRLFENRE